jgi:predicted permease
MPLDWRRGPWRHVIRRGSEIRADVDDEIRFHIEMRIADLKRRGHSASAARAEALRQFGDLEETRSICMSSDERRESHMRRRWYFDEMRQDVVHGFRHLRRRWSLTGLAVLTLGVGVGASTAIFSATDHVLLRPLPYAHTEAIVTLWETDEQQGQRTLEVSAGNFLAWQKRNRTLESIALAEPYSYDLATDGPPEAVRTWRVTQDWFTAMGVQPLVGRLFRPEEYEPNGPLAVLISEGLWQRRFGSDPRVVGQTLRVDGGLATIAGVIPGEVKYPETTEIWGPKVFRPDELIDHTSQYMRVVGRLKPGFTVAQAQEDLQRIARDLEREHPATNRNSSVNIIPLSDQVLGKVRPALLILLGAVGFLLLIACANVASLLLAAGAERGRELSVRAALGAGRRRLIHQLGTESLLLALMGGALGLVLARVGVKVLIALSPPELPRIDSVSIDGRVLTFSLGITLFTALLCGLAPALRFSRPDLLAILRATGRSVTSGRERNRLRAALVRAEIAAALVLLIGAGLLARSFVRLLSNDLGFEATNRATLQAFLWDLNPEPQQMANKVAEFEAALRAVPGVRNVGIVSALPFHPHAINAQAKLRIRGREVPEAEVPLVFTTIATPSYFAALSIPIRSGRSFTDLDRANAPKVVLINEALARRYFPGENPVGQMITVGAMSRPEPREIVGVIADVRPLTLDSEARPEVFVPFAQNVTGSLTFVIETTRPAGAMLPALRDRFWSVDARQSIYWSATLEEMVGATLVERRFNLVLLAVFSAIALILATVAFTDSSASARSSVLTRSVSGSPWAPSACRSSA